MAVAITGRAERSCWPPVSARSRGAFIWGLARRSDRPSHGVHLVGGHDNRLATGIMVFTPGPERLDPGPGCFWCSFRVFVGIGNAGIFTIDLPLVQEFIPAYKRGWVSALVTTLAAGGRHAGPALWPPWLLPIIGLALLVPGRACRRSCWCS